MVVSSILGNNYRQVLLATQLISACPMGLYLAKIFGGELVNSDGMAQKEGVSKYYVSIG